MKNFLLLALSLILYSCSCKKCDEEKYIYLSPVIQENAKEFIASYVGEEFYTQNINLNKAETDYSNNNYNLVFDIVIKEKPYFYGKIKFSMDTLGNVNPLIEVTGLPNCIENPENCNPNISEEKALEIAKNKGLEPGMKEWKKAILWNSKWQKYTWYILNTLYASEGSEGFRGNGKEIIIDISTGEILEFNNWKVN